MCICLYYSFSCPSMVTSYLCCVWISLVTVRYWCRDQLTGILRSGVSTLVTVTNPSLLMMTGKSLLYSSKGWMVNLILLSDFAMTDNDSHTMLASTGLEIRWSFTLKKILSFLSFFSCILVNSFLFIHFFVTLFCIVIA